MAITFVHEQIFSFVCFECYWSVIITQTSSSANSSTFLLKVRFNFKSFCVVDYLCDLFYFSSSSSFFLLSGVMMRSVLEILMCNSFASPIKWLLCPSSLFRSDEKEVLTNCLHQLNFLFFFSLSLSHSSLTN